MIKILSPRVSHSPECRLIPGLCPHKPECRPVFQSSSNSASDVGAAPVRTNHPGGLAVALMIGAPMLMFPMNGIWRIVGAALVRTNHPGNPCGCPNDRSACVSLAVDKATRFAATRFANFWKAAKS